MQPAPEVIKWYWALLGMLGSATAAVFGAGAYFEGIVTRIEKVENRIEAHDDVIAAINSEVKARLYHPDGGLIYVRATDCDKLQANCPATAAIESFGKKVDKLIELHMKNGSGGHD